MWQMFIISSGTSWGAVHWILNGSVSHKNSCQRFYKDVASGWKKVEFNKSEIFKYQSVWPILKPI